MTSRYVWVAVVLLVGVMAAKVFYHPEKISSLYQIDFEDGSFSGWRSDCGRCDFHLGNKQFVVKDPENRNGLSALYVGGKRRNESASEYMPLDQDLTIRWSLYFDRNFSSTSSGTVSQLIGWQLPCFTGGMFHLRYDKGYWGYWYRNLPQKHDLKLPIKIPVGEWIDLEVKARFTSLDNGYFKLNIDQLGTVYSFDVVKKGVTFKNCERGPYLKIGFYGEFDQRDMLYVDNVSAYSTE